MSLVFCFCRRSHSLALSTSSLEAARDFLERIPEFQGFDFFRVLFAVVCTVYVADWLNLTKEKQHFLHEGISSHESKPLSKYELKLIFHSHCSSSLSLWWRRRNIETKKNSKNTRRPKQRRGGEKCVIWIIIWVTFDNISSCSTIIHFDSSPLFLEKFFFSFCRCGWLSQSRAHTAAAQQLVRLKSRSHQRVRRDLRIRQLVISYFFSIPNRWTFTFVSHS